MARKRTNAAPLKRFTLNIPGPIGLKAVVDAASREAAAELLKKALPNEVEVEVEDKDIKRGVRSIDVTITPSIVSYIHADAGALIVASNPDDEEEEADEDDEEDEEEEEDDGDEDEEDDDEDEEDDEDEDEDDDEDEEDDDGDDYE